MTPDIEIIIVNFNTRGELDACLTSLHDHKPQSVAGIVVVDNHSSDGSAAMVRARWPNVDVIELDSNVGFGAGNNVALRRTKAPLALLLNSDTRVPAGAIDKLRERMRARNAVAAGPKIIDGDGQVEISFGRMLTPFAELIQRWRVRAASTKSHWAHERIQRHMAEERFVDWVTGACLLLDVPAARSVGFFDERFFLYEEDVDLCASLRAAGGRVLYTPAAEIVHLRGRSVESQPRSAESAALYDRSHLAFYQKHSPRWVPWLVLWQRLRGRRVR